MAVASLFRHISKSQNLSSVFCNLRSLATLASPPHAPKPFINPYLGRQISSPTVTFGQLSRASSLTVPYQNHPTIGAVTYPTSLLGGCFDQYKGEAALVPIQGMNFPLLPLKITPEEREEDLTFALQRNGSSDVKDFMDSMGVGMFPHQSEELREEELSVAIAPPSLHKELSMSDECYAAAMSSLVDAVLEYSYFAMGIRCATKKIKFAKWRKGRMGGISHRGNVISFGNYALQVLDAAWITAKQLEAGRRALSRIVGRGAKIWVRAICDKPVTQRPAETRMGRGKGSVSFFVAVVQPGRILYEISGVTESIARKAVDVAASKLPVQTRFIITA